MVKIIKINNSIAVEIPHFIQEKAMLKAGDVVHIELTEKNYIRIKRHGAKTSPRLLRLHALLSRVTPENLHQETDWGRSVGHEYW